MSPPPPKKAFVSSSKLYAAPARDAWAPSRASTAGRLATETTQPAARARRTCCNLVDGSDRPGAQASCRRRSTDVHGAHAERMPARGARAADLCAMTHTCCMRRWFAVERAAAAARLSRASTTLYAPTSSAATARRRGGWRVSDRDSERRSECGRRPCRAPHGPHVPPTTMARQTTTRLPARRHAADRRRRRRRRRSPPFRRWKARPRSKVRSDRAAPNDGC